MVVGGGAAGGGGGGHLEDPSGGGGEPRGSVPRPRRWLGDLPQPSVPLGDDSTGAGRRLRAVAARRGGVAVRYLRRMNGGHRDGDLPATLSPATGQRSVCWRASAIARVRWLFSRRSRAHICAGHRARANISAGDRAHFGDRAQTFQPASSAIYNMCTASFLQIIKRIPARQPCLATTRQPTLLRPCLPAKLLPSEAGNSSAIYNMCTASFQQTIKIIQKMLLKTLEHQKSQLDICQLSFQFPCT